MSRPRGMVGGGRQVITIRGNGDRFLEGSSRAPLYLDMERMGVGAHDWHVWGYIAIPGG